MREGDVKSWPATVSELSQFPKSPEIRTLHELGNVPVMEQPALEASWVDAVAFEFDDVRSCEEIVDSRDIGIRSSRFYSRKDRLNWPYLQQLFENDVVGMRASVAERLRLANEDLRAFGVELLLLDGVRTLQEQGALWIYFFNSVRELRPDLTSDDVERAASEFCYNPTNFQEGLPSTWPVHLTGGSVDLTLVRAGCDEQLFMGGTFDDPSELSRTAHFERLVKSRGSISQLSTSEQFALLARRLLVWSLERHGMTNYCGEWWHFDFGTSLWARARSLQNAKAKAFYGLAAPRS